MIVLDIETSGLTGRNGIWQIGAIDLNDTSKYFLEESRIDDEDEVSKEAEKVHGKSEAYLRDKNKQPQKRMIMNYLDWVSEIEEKMFVGQNIGWDVSIIQDKCLKYGLQNKSLDVHAQRTLDLHTIAQRTLDLHTIAQEKYKQINGIYLLNKDGKSAMNLSKILEFCGLPDDRVNVTGNEVVKEGRCHSALDDCKLEGECYWRLEKGQELFSRYNHFLVPEYLIKSDNKFIRR